MTTLLIALVMLVGIAGTIVPLVPGVSLMWAAALAYGILEGFGPGGWVAFAIITVLALLAVASNVVLPGRRAGKVGAANSSIVLGIVGAVIGLFAIPVIGLPLGGAAGIWVGERLQGQPSGQAWLATKETLIGIGVSMIAQFVIAVWMMAVWLLWVWLG